MEFLDKSTFRSQTGLMLSNGPLIVASLCILILFLASVARRSREKSQTSQIIVESIKENTSQGQYLAVDSERSTNQKQKSAIISSSPSFKAVKQSASVPTNTHFDLDEFILRMYKTGFLLKRNKNGVAKLRCVVISERCELCMHKDVRALLSATGHAYPKPYIRISLRELRDSFQCDGAMDPSFILEFRNHSLHFTAVSALDALYLATGFRALSVQLKGDADGDFFASYGVALAEEPSRYSLNKELRRLARGMSRSASGLPQQPQSGTSWREGSGPTGSGSKSRKQELEQYPQEEDDYCSDDDEEESCASSIQANVMRSPL